MEWLGSDRSSAILRNSTPFWIAFQLPESTMARLGLCFSFPGASDETEMEDAESRMTRTTVGNRTITVKIAEYSWKKNARLKIDPLLNAGRVAERRYFLLIQPETYGSRNRRQRSKNCCRSGAERRY
jgi:hypothetical protein